MLRVSYDKMYNEFLRVLIKIGFTEERARLCSKLFTETSLDGVYSHGLNRFPSFIDLIKKGNIDINAEPAKLDTIGVLERWDGKFGPGNLNAYFSMGRAIELAKLSGMGCVALKNNNHWMRAGSYGWQAAEENCIGVCWTNTLPNMPPWGAKEARIGNNPLVLAVPREGGHVVLDTAMSQYSYGQMQSHQLRNEMLEVYGGYDKKGNLTTDPEAIIETKRTLPIGYWKGSGLSIMLDMISMILSGGNSTYEIGKFDGDFGVSQIFIAFDISKLPNGNALADNIENTINYIHSAEPIDENIKIRYPGEGTIIKRSENLSKGIPVDEEIWKQVLDM
jgi:3-dehydro-L-gulonate 2-dehydrogenase